MRQALQGVAVANNFWEISMRKLVTWISFTLAFSCVSSMGADEPAGAPPRKPADVAPTNPPADNSGINIRDKSAAIPTPRSQTSHAEDRKLLAAVRRTVVRDKSLSISAHNVKIVAKGSVVTLRGSVKSEDEKAKIEKLALQVAGVASVENQLDVKTK